MVIIIQEFLLVYVFVGSVYSAPTSQTEDVDQVCSSTCSLEISNNKRKKVDTTATDVINSMAVYLRTLSVQITEDKIAVPERPRITLILCTTLVHTAIRALARLKTVRLWIVPHRRLSSLFLSLVCSGFFCSFTTASIFFV